MPPTCNPARRRGASPYHAAKGLSPYHAAEEPSQCRCRTMPSRCRCRTMPPWGRRGAVAVSCRRGAIAVPLPYHAVAVPHRRGAVAVPRRAKIRKKIRSHRPRPAGMQQNSASPQSRGRTQHRRRGRIPGGRRPFTDLYGRSDYSSQATFTDVISSASVSPLVRRIKSMTSFNPSENFVKSSL